MEAVIETSNITKKYKDVLALNNLSFKAYRGEVLGLLGVNGAGKTTLIKVLTGLCSKSKGEAFILGYNLDNDLAKIKSLINVSPQTTSVALNLTVKENLAFFKGIYDVKDEAYIQKIVQIFHLDEVMNKKAKKLSGGWARRLSIAVSLINKPEILFLDEPTLGLDVLARRSLWEIIRGLKGEMTIILTSHYLEEIEALCDHVLIMSKGVKKAYGTTKELLEETKTTSLEDAFVKIVGIEEMAE